jgi:opacity protein-like surface antigen
VRIVSTLALVLCVSGAAFAQPPDDRRPPPPSRGSTDAPAISLRPFVMGTEQSFAAVNTFEAVFGQSRQPFFGGGLQVLLGGRYYVNATASRFKKTGERAFRFDGENFQLGLPLTAEITPFEITGGYRFRPHSSIVPYGGAGYGTYKYKETSPSSDADENVTLRHGGFVADGGVELRVHRWIGVGVDVQYTRILGVLGTGGISKEAGEKDLGGVAARFMLIVGR